MTFAIGKKITVVNEANVDYSSPFRVLSSFVELRRPPLQRGMNRATNVLAILKRVCKQVCDRNHKSIVN